MSDDVWWKLDGRRPVRCTREEWSVWRKSHRDERIVARDHVGGMDVCTVFDGVDQSGIPDGPPLVFTSAVAAIWSTDFLRTAHYPTWDEAEHGHKLMVAWAKAVKEREEIHETPGE